MSIPPGAAGITASPKLRARRKRAAALLPARHERALAVDSVPAIFASAQGPDGRHARARLGHRASVGRRSVVAMVVGAMAPLVAVPIPFGNVPPALALMLIGLGRVFRDGFAVILGLLTSGGRHWLPRTACCWWPGPGLRVNPGLGLTVNGTNR